MSMIYKNLMIEDKDSIIEITINRKEKLNVLNKNTLGEIKNVFEYVDSNFHKIRGVVLTGTGEKAFSAGADISEFLDLSPEDAYQYSLYGQEVFASIENARVPVVAVIGGYALGGGCELAISTHFRIASSHSKFGQPEVNLGLIPGFGGTQRLPRLMGSGKAIEFMTTGNIIDSNQAECSGLLNYVLPDKEKAMLKAHQLISKITKNAPVAVNKVLESVFIKSKDIKSGYEQEAAAFAKCFATKDFKEGIEAFMEKRTPKFKGQ